MKYYLFDVQGKILGRSATEIAQVLRGKKKIIFAPHKDDGDAVVVVNSDKVMLSGLKSQKKMYHRFSGYPGGITSINFQDQLKKDSRKIIREAVRGMLPKNKLRDRMMKRLFIYKDDKHPYAGEINAD
jgi:large subunit ribosomal protein L13